MTIINVSEVNGETNLKRGGVEVGYYSINMFNRISNTGTDVLWASSGNAEWPSTTSTARYRFPVDLRLFDEVRWQFFVNVGANAGSLRLRYATTVGGSTSDIISGGATLACTGTTAIRDTGWNDLDATAKSSAVEIAVLNVSVTLGNPDIWRMMVEFRAKST